LTASAWLRYKQGKPLPTQVLGLGSQGTQAPKLTPKGGIPNPKASSKGGIPNPKASSKGKTPKATSKTPEATSKTPKTKETTPKTKERNMIDNVEGELWKFPWSYNVEFEDKIGRLPNEMFRSFEDRFEENINDLNTLRKYVRGVIGKNTFVVIVKKGETVVIDDDDDSDLSFNKILESSGVVWVELDIDEIDPQIDLEELFDKQIFGHDYLLIWALLKTGLRDEAIDVFLSIAEIQNTNEVHTGPAPRNWVAYNKIYDIFDQDTDPLNLRVMAEGIVLDAILCANGILHDAPTENGLQIPFVYGRDNEQCLLTMDISDNDKRKFQQVFKNYKFEELRNILFPSYIDTAPANESVKEYIEVRKPDSIDALVQLIPNCTAINVVPEDKWEAYMSNAPLPQKKTGVRNMGSDDDSDNPDGNPIDVLPEGTVPKYAIGTKMEVWARRAMVTPGGLRRDDLGLNEHCKVVSLKASTSAQKRYHDDPDNAAEQFQAWNEMITNDHFPESSKRARYDPDVSKAQHYAPKRANGSWTIQMREKDLAQIRAEDAASEGDDDEFEPGSSDEEEVAPARGRVSTRSTPALF
jgi:hypothetical protein